MTEAVDVELVSRTLTAGLVLSGMQVVLSEVANGKPVIVPPDSAAAVDGLLPMFLAAGEAVWKEATGYGFGLEIEGDEGALLGWRVKGMGETLFSAVMLAVFEAASQAARPDGIVVNELITVRQDATERYDAAVVNREAWASAHGGKT